MEVLQFHEMLSDKHFPDYTALHCKYGDLFPSFSEELYKVRGVTLPLRDLSGEPLWLLEGLVTPPQSAVKTLLYPQKADFGRFACEREIIASNAIENIDLQRESVRNILRGLAPMNEQEDRIYGQKLGFSFIADPANRITEDNIYKLYRLTVGDFLPPETALPRGMYYRNDEVFVVSSRVEHTGAPAKKLPALMAELTAFIGADDGMNDLVKAAVIHYDFAYLHPYFDGNGRMARLMHLWFLVQKGYRSALFLPFSYEINLARRQYYNAFTTVSKNRELCGRTDVTPFVMFFIEHVYRKLEQNAAAFALDDRYTRETLPAGKITPKENALWEYVRATYGDGEFSTKELEKSYGAAAYATIRKFVQRFTEEGYLRAVRYGSRVKYRINIQEE